MNSITKCYRAGAGWWLGGALVLLDLSLFNLIKSK